MTSNHSAATPAAEALAGRLARLGPGAGVDGRQAVLPDPLQAFHRRLLKAFVTGTGAPDAAVVARRAAELGLDPEAALAALAALAAADLVHTDPATGSISIAYPFSGRPTPHRVELAGGPTVSAMCALDALGIPQMTRRDARISSTDPTSGQQIAVDDQLRATGSRKPGGDVAVRGAPQDPVVHKLANARELPLHHVEALRGLRQERVEHERQMTAVLDRGPQRGVERLAEAARGQGVGGAVVPRPEGAEAREVVARV